MVGTFNIADNIIQIAAEKDFPVYKVLAAEIVDNTKNNQRRDNQLGLQIADQYCQQHNYQQINISIRFGIHIPVKPTEHYFHLKSGTAAELYLCFLNLLAGRIFLKSITISKAPT